MANQQTRLATQADQATTTAETKRQGARELCQAADMILDEDCLEIAKALSKSGKEGHLQSIKFLYELAKSANESDHDDDDSRSSRQARELAAEPQWQDEDPEEDQEFSAGTQEPDSYQ
jgi:hypothetical protein